jgi:uncharacterized protein YraI
MTRAGIRSWIIGLAMALPAAAMAAQAYTTTAVNLRAGPDTDYPVVRWVPEGTAVEVHGCLADYRWCDVEVYGDRGWMSASYLVYPYESYNAPIVTYGPVIGLPMIGFAFDSYWDDHYRWRPWYGDRHRWAHRHRPEFDPPRFRPPQHRPPQFRPPANRPPEFRPPQVQPQPIRPPLNRPPSFQPPDINARPQQPNFRPPQPPSFRPPQEARPMRPPAARPPGPPSPPPVARPPSPPPMTNRPTPGRDPRSLHDNSGERGGMNTGNF